MLEQTSKTILFYAFYTASQTGKTGLTVTIDVYNPAGSLVVTGGSATALGGGLYYYSLSSGSTASAGNYLAIFKTTDTTVDQKHIPALWVIGETWVQNVDTTVSSRNSGAVDILQSAADKVWSTTARALTDKAGFSLSAAGVQAVWDALTSALTTAGSVGKRIADFLDAAISSRLAASSYSDPLTSLVPGSYAGGTAGAALGRIGSGQVTTVSVVAQNGDISVIKADDYYATDARSYDFIDVSAAWPVLTAATITFYIYLADTNTTVLSKAGSIIVATGANKQVRVELTTSDTAKLNQFGMNIYKHSIKATLASGHIITLLEGKVTTSF
jgi:hypothetical protein